jgi:WD repeat-containing protein 68
MTQLIAHDREVYDVAWLPGSTDIFVSVGADGSLRAFDLRSLEHSTILYETPAPKNVPLPTSNPSASARPPTSPLLRIAFNPSDSNYMSTFHMDGSDVQILDMRSPGQPVIELRGHQGPINALGWGSADHPLLATAGEVASLFAITNTNERYQGMTAKYCCGTSPTIHRERHLHAAPAPV